MARELRVAILAARAVDSAGGFQPYSYGAYRVLASLLDDAPGGDAEMRLFEGVGWTSERFISEVEPFDPDIVGLSVQVWSFPTLVAVAGELKRHRGDRLVVMGGPSARPEMFTLPPWRSASSFIDALVLGEGEEVMRDLVKEHHRSRGTLAAVPGLAVAVDGLFRRTAPRAALERPDAFRSPSQLGLPPRGLTAHLETFRGCPMTCLFCQEGAASSTRRLFALEYLIEELHAFKECGASGVYLIDPGINLCRRAAHRLLAAEEEVGFLRGSEFTCEAYPRPIAPEMLELLSSTRAVVGVGVQSLDPDVLRRASRPCDLERLQQCVEPLARVCAVQLELILGLPGDTPRSFRVTLDRALHLGCNVRVFHCLVLPDALMSRAPASFRLRYDPQTLELLSGGGWSEDQLRRESDRLCELAELKGGWHARDRPAAYNHTASHAIVPGWVFPGGGRPVQLDGMYRAEGQCSQLPTGEPSANVYEMLDGGRKKEGESDMLESEEEQMEVLFDYTMRPYRAAARQGEQRLASVNVLHTLLQPSPQRQRFRQLLTEVQCALGRNRIVWGVKLEGGVVRLELYFYFRTLSSSSRAALSSYIPRRITQDQVYQALAGTLDLEVRCPDYMPAVMISVDIDERTLHEGRTNLLHLYLLSGLSYDLTPSGLHHANHYSFFELSEPDRLRALVTHLTNGMAHASLAGNDLQKVLIPSLYSCRTICLAAKREADAIYFSGLRSSQLLWFLQQYGWPDEAARLVADNAPAFDHVRWDVGIDFIAGDGDIHPIKTGIYGTL